tara:strand:+ start:1403 stop:2371 length:969 start_codon:yes stop_codon:yes gene_type:complete
MLIIPFCSFSQKKDSISNVVYFESMRDKFNLKLEFDNDIVTFEYNDLVLQYSVRPNTSVRTVLGFSYRFIGLKIGYSPKLLAPEDFDKKGETKVFKISTNIFIKRWIQTLEYAKVEGYYIQEFENGDEVFDNTTYIILSDLKTQVIRGKTSFVLNQNLSMRAIINQVEIQRKSAGSFMPSLSYEFFNLSDVYTMFKTQSFNFVFNANYIHTFVINKRWYANLGFAPGIGFGINKLTEGEFSIITKSNDLIVNFNSFVNLGYNSKNFYAGISYELDASIPSEESVVKYSSVRNVFNLSIGYRFNPPRFLEKSFDWVTEHTPLK